MKRYLDLINNNSKLILVSLMVLSIFICLSCVSASDDVSNLTVADNSSHVDLNNEVSAGMDAADADNGVSKNNADLKSDKLSKINVGGEIFISQMYNVREGQHWEVSDETHGVTLTSKKIISPYYGANVPLCVYNTKEVQYTFRVTDSDYYIKLVLYDSYGNVIQQDIRSA